METQLSPPSLPTFPHVGLVPPETPRDKDRNVCRLFSGMRIERRAASAVRTARLGPVGAWGSVPLGTPGGGGSVGRASETPVCPVSSLQRVG